MKDVQINAEIDYWEAMNEITRLNNELLLERTAKLQVIQMYEELEKELEEFKKNNE